MDAIKSIILLGTVALVAGCAAHPDPIIDMKGVDQEQFVQDWNDCEGYSEEVQMSKGIAKGSAVGAAVGAVAGAIGGNSSDVAEGAAYGGLYGGAESGLDADREKQYVFKRCMSGRGYRVLN
ncbi:MAG: glycine zipper family protein [Gammaproteobacteria bacterium]|nr:glycine zipper family protein [Gammaproteobacteria bacterium]MDH3749087.1 glycine zipper family protein [Gammaproteobacteria bacterium]MDH3806052.1 glycine zipper family protein [Gammaproteobacteria bacterium]